MVSPFPTTRFAPSPTGYLHLGHAYSAILNHDRARAAGGRFLLRIEDIDAGRCKLAFEDAIYDDLRWLGLRWDEPVLRQSDRLAVYAARLDELIARGLVYRCFRTRADVAEALRAAHGPADGGFRPGPLAPSAEASNLADGLPFAWRLNLEEAQAQALAQALAQAQHSGKAGQVVFKQRLGGEVHDVIADPAAHGDVVIARKDIGTSYHLAAVTDDLDSGVTDVIRGADLEDVAPLHALLSTLLGEEPPIYEHHRLILGPDGKRLAKRDRSVTLASLRDAGETPDGIRARLSA